MSRMRLERLKEIENCPYDIPGIKKRFVNASIRLAVRDRQEILYLREKLLRTEIEVLELREKLVEVAGRREVGI